MQEPDGTIQVGRRYVLGHGEGFYGIWDRELPGKPVESFELTDQGLQEARKRIAYLARQDFWARIGPKALRWALFGGLGVWILAGIVLWIRLWDGDFASPSSGPIAPLELTPYFESGWVKVIRGAETVAFRLWVGAVAILVALRLFERGRPAA